MVKKKCCHKFVKKGKHCSKCPIVDECALQEKIITAKKKKKASKALKKKK